MKAIALLVLAASTAAADPDPVPPFVPERVTLRTALEVGVPITDTYQPTSLAIDGWYDVNERFRIGVTTSNDARRELGAGRGLCLASCDPEFAGVAADAQVRLGPALIGRAAIDTARFSPTVAAVELGADLFHAEGRWSVRVSPTLRLGVARRDLDNGDTGAALAQIALRAWPSGGLLALARVGVTLGDVSATPSLGAAGGTWFELGKLTLSARFGAADFTGLHVSDTVFAELALAWST